MTSELRELLETAEPAHRAKMDGEIRQWLATAMDSNEPEQLRRFLRVFPQGTWGRAARRRLWDHLPSDTSPLDRELVLWALLNDGDVQPSQLVLDTDHTSEELAETQGWAWYQLSTHLRNQKRLAEAATCLAPLAGPFADKVVHNGQLGSERIAALPDNDPVRALAAGAQAWPTGKIEVEKLKGPRAQGRQYYPAVSKAAGPYTSGAGLLGDLQILIDPQQQKLAASDVWGRQQWTATLPNLPNADKSPINRAMTQLEYEGHLIVARQGTFLFGLDALSGKSLWSRDLLEVFPGEQVQRHVGGRPSPRIGGLPQLRLYDRTGNAIGDMGAVVNGHIAVQSGRKIQYIDARTGKPQWIRNGMPEGADLYGDRECIVVQPWVGPNSLVLHPDDGSILHEVENRGAENLVTTIGRFVLTWEPEKDQGQLILFDPLRRENVWQATYDSNAQFWRCAHDELAILQRDGTFCVRGILDGQPRLEAQLDAEPDLTHLFVFRSAQHYVVLANRPHRHDLNVMNVNALGHFASPPLNAVVYGLDRQRGTQVWKTVVDRQGLLLDQPHELPIFTFACRIYEPIKNNRRRSYSAVKCLDIRTGAIVHEEEIATSAAYVQFLADPVKHELEIRTQSTAVKFTFHAEKADTAQP